MGVRKNRLKCHDKNPDCFAYKDGHCGLLCTFTKGKEIVPGTKFGDRPCPFFKTVKQAGGTCEELFKKYPLPKGKTPKEKARC